MHRVADGHARLVERGLRVFDRWVNEPRASELSRVRRRLIQSLADITPDADTRQRAHRLLDLRVRLSAALGSVGACSHCVLPKSSHWPGGHCCSGSTDAIFTGDELAALRLTGTKPIHLVAPREPLAGCVFRGRDGCSLSVEHRPCLCVRYTCRELESELTARGDRAAIAELQTRLRLAFSGFSELLDKQRKMAEPL